MLSYLRRLFTPIPLITLAASMLTFWITQTWWILALGFLATGIIAVQSKLSEIEEDAEDYGYDLSHFSPEVKHKFISILTEKEKILTELRGKRDDIFLNTEEISTRVNELVDDYYDLLLKLTNIMPFIGQNVIGALNTSIKDLRNQIERCSDEVTRQNLSLTLKNKTDQLNRLMELNRYKERIESQLLNLASALNSLYVRIVQIRLSPDGSLDPTKEIKESLDSLFMDVEISEKITREFHQMVREDVI